jgi:hypothetical protein
MILNYLDFIIEENHEVEYWISNRLYDLIERMQDSTTSTRMIDLIGIILGINNSKQDNITYLDVTDKNDIISFFSLDKLFQIYYEEKKLTGDRNFKKISDQTFEDFIEWLPNVFDSTFKDPKSFLWNSPKRTDINVGRLFVKILTKIKIDFKPKEIEELVNLYKSTYDKINGLKTFHLVKGEEILKYYLEDNYEIKSGDLNNSCR